MGGPKGSAPIVARNFWIVALFVFVGCGWFPQEASRPPARCLPLPAVDRPPPPLHAQSVHEVPAPTNRSLSRSFPGASPGVRFDLLSWRIIASVVQVGLGGCAERAPRRDDARRWVTAGRGRPFFSQRTGHTRRRSSMQLFTRGEITLSVSACRIGRVSSRVPGASACCHGNSGVCIHGEQGRHFSQVPRMHDVTI